MGSIYRLMRALILSELPEVKATPVGLLELALPGVGLMELGVRVSSVKG